MAKKVTPSILTFKIHHHGELIFVHLTLSDACNNQFFYKLFHFVMLTNYTVCMPASSNFFFFAKTKWAIPSGQDGPILPAG